jgi:hypothetical protein
MAVRSVAPKPKGPVAIVPDGRGAALYRMRSVVGMVRERTTPAREVSAGLGDIIPSLTVFATSYLPQSAGRTELRKR